MLEMASKAEKILRKKLDVVRHPAMLALRGVRIGPIFPPREDLEGILPGKRGVPRSKTKFPYGTLTDSEKHPFPLKNPFSTFFHIPYREKRRTRNRISSRSRSKNRE